MHSIYTQSRALLLSFLVVQACASAPPIVAIDDSRPTLAQFEDTVFTATSDCTGNATQPCTATVHRVENLVAERIYQSPPSTDGTGNDVYGGMAALSRTELYLNLSSGKLIHIRDSVSETVSLPALLRSWKGGPSGVWAVVRNADENVWRFGIVEQAAFRVVATIEVPTDDNYRIHSVFENGDALVTSNSESRPAFRISPSGTQTAVNAPLSTIEPTIRASLTDVAHDLTIENGYDSGAIVGSVGRHPVNIALGFVRDAEVFGTEDDFVVISKIVRRSTGFGGSNVSDNSAKVCVSRFHAGQSQTECGQLADTLSPYLHTQTHLYYVGIDGLRAIAIEAQ